MKGEKGTKKNGCPYRQPFYVLKEEAIFTDGLHQFYIHNNAPTMKFGTGAKIVPISTAQHSYWDVVIRSLITHSFILNQTKIFKLTI
jgi:hypothetical protein